MQVVRNIRKIRELKGYSQEYIASQMNISQRSYSRIEKNEIELNLNKLHQICEILEVPLKELFEFDEQKLFNPGEINQQDSGSTIGYKEKEFYEVQIQLLKDEVAFLRSQFKKSL